MPTAIRSIFSFKRAAVPRLLSASVSCVTRFVAAHSCTMSFADPCKICNRPTSRKQRQVYRISSTACGLRSWFGWAGVLYTPTCGRIRGTFGRWSCSPGAGSAPVALHRRGWRIHARRLTSLLRPPLAVVTVHAVGLVDLGRVMAIAGVDPVDTQSCEHSFSVHE